MSRDPAATPMPLTVPLEVYDRTMAVNQRGYLLCTRHALPHLDRRRRARSSTRARPRRSRASRARRLRDVEGRRERADAARRLALGKAGRARQLDHARLRLHRAEPQRRCRRRSRRADARPGRAARGSGKRTTSRRWSRCCSPRTASGSTARRSASTAARSCAERHAARRSTGGNALPRWVAGFLRGARQARGAACRGDRPKVRMFPVHWPASSRARGSGIDLANRAAHAQQARNREPAARRRAARRARAARARARRRGSARGAAGAALAGAARARVPRAARGRDPGPARRAPRRRARPSSSACSRTSPRELQKLDEGLRLVDRVPVAAARADRAWSPRARSTRVDATPGPRGAALAGWLVAGMALGIALADGCDAPRWLAALPAAAGLAARVRAPLARRCGGARSRSRSACTRRPCGSRRRARRARASRARCVVEGVVARRSSALAPRWIELDVGARRGRRARARVLRREPGDLDAWLPGDRLRARLRLAPLRWARNPGDGDPLRRLWRAGLAVGGSLPHPSLAAARDARARTARRSCTGCARGSRWRSRAAAARAPVCCAASRSAMPKRSRPSSARCSTGSGSSTRSRCRACISTWVSAALYALSRAALRRSAWLAARCDTRRLALAARVRGGARLRGARGLGACRCGARCSSCSRRGSRCCAGARSSRAHRSPRRRSGSSPRSPTRCSRPARSSRSRRWRRSCGRCAGRRARARWGRRGAAHERDRDRGDRADRRVARRRRVGRGARRELDRAAVARLRGAARGARRGGRGGARAAGRATR